MVWLRKLFRTRSFRARSWDKKLGPLPSKNSLKWSGVPTAEGVNRPVIGRTAESQVFQFTMSIFLSIHLRVLKMFWGAVFRARLVLGRILAADCTGVCALLYCKSALVLVVWVSSDTGIGTGMQFFKAAVHSVQKSAKNELAFASGYRRFDVLGCRRTRSHGLRSSMWLQKMVCMRYLINC